MDLTEKVTFKQKILQRQGHSHMISKGRQPQVLLK